MDLTNFYSFGLGIGTKNKKGSWLDVFYPVSVLKPMCYDVSKIAEVLGYYGGDE